MVDDVVVHLDGDVNLDDLRSQVQAGTSVATTCHDAVHVKVVDHVNVNLDVNACPDGN